MIRNIGVNVYDSHQNIVNINMYSTILIYYHLIPKNRMDNPLVFRACTGRRLNRKHVFVLMSHTYSFVKLGSSPSSSQTYMEFSLPIVCAITKLRKISGSKMKEKDKGNTSRISLALTLSHCKAQLQGRLGSVHLFWAVLYPTKMLLL